MTCQSIQSCAPDSVPAQRGEKVCSNCQANALRLKRFSPESVIVAAGEAAGFVLAEKSEINANPKDTKDYEEGVWTLPPGLALKEKDREKYVAIGESDRMTLRFVKPE